jgi:hypothetical protein
MDTPHKSLLRKIIRTLIHPNKFTPEQQQFEPSTRRNKAIMRDNNSSHRYFATKSFQRNNDSTRRYARNKAIMREQFEPLIHRNKSHLKEQFAQPIRSNKIPDTPR